MLVWMHRLSVGGALALLVGLSAVVCSQEASTPSAGLATRQLAALQAFLKQVGAHNLRIPEAELVLMIQRQLEGRSTPGPHQAPTTLELAKRLDQHYQSVWDRMVAKAVEGLDADGRHDLEGWLRSEIQRKPKLQELLQRRKTAYLEKDFPRNLSAATAELARQQTSVLRRVFEQYLADRAGLEPQQIEAAYDRGGEAERALAQQLRAEVLQKAPDSLRKTLLAEASTSASGTSERVVRQAIEDLNQQLKALDEKAQSHTLDGIHAELESRLKTIAKAQSDQAQVDPLVKSFGVFPRAASTLDRAALRHFDDQVRLVVDSVAREFQNGRQTVLDAREPAADRQQQTRDALLSNLTAHHNRAESWKLFLSEHVPQWLSEDRQWLYSRVEQDAARSKSPFDARGQNAKARLRSAVAQRLAAANSSPAQAWQSFRKLLTEQYRQLIFASRDQLGAQQAKAFCPSLANGTWLPTEREIIAFDAQSFGRRELRMLTIPWKNSTPPEDKQVLAETWTLWENAAREALALGRQAAVEQTRIVEAEKGPIAEKLGRSPQQLSNAFWIEEYTRIVQNEWEVHRSKSIAAPRHPDLFVGTREKIAGIVADLLDDLARDVQRELVQQEAPNVKLRIEEETNRGIEPEFRPHCQRFTASVTQQWSDWIKRHPDWASDHPAAAKNPKLLDEVVLEIEGLVRRFVEAEVRKPPAAISVAKPATPAGGSPAEDVSRSPPQVQAVSNPADSSSPPAVESAGSSSGPGLGGPGQGPGVGGVPAEVDPEIKDKRGGGGKGALPDCILVFTDTVNRKALCSLILSEPVAAAVRQNPTSPVAFDPQDVEASARSVARQMWPVIQRAVLAKIDSAGGEKSDATKRPKSFRMHAHIRTDSIRSRMMIHLRKLLEQEINSSTGNELRIEWSESL